MSSVEVHVIAIAMWLILAIGALYNDKVIVASIAGVWVGVHIWHLWNGRRGK